MEHMNNEQLIVQQGAIQALSALLQEQEVEQSKKD